LSLLLHAGAIYAVTRVPWHVSHVPPLPPPTAVVWMRELPPPKAVVPEPEPEPEPAPAISTAPPPVEPAPDLPSPAVEPPTERPPPSPPRRTARRAPAPPPEQPVPQPAEAPAPQPPPVIDWEKERRAAIRDMIENPQRGFRTFSPDDLPERKLQPLPIEPAPPAMTERCAVFKNRFQAMMLAMVGKCVRDARDDLFVDARPAYLDEKPRCRETRPDSPGALASDGRIISTVKCELVPKDADDASSDAAAEPR
jgi:outer membrane biosynthesis protein TonB